jgi:hypothetical protein
MKFIKENQRRLGIWTGQENEEIVVQENNNRGRDAERIFERRTIVVIGYNMPHQHSQKCIMHTKCI